MHKNVSLELKVLCKTVHNANAIEGFHTSHSGNGNISWMVHTTLDGNKISADSGNKISTS
jgi:hypothetical protein